MTISDNGCQQSSFNTGVLLIPNSIRMREMCSSVLPLIQKWHELKLGLSNTMEQPFITYQVHRYRAVNHSAAERYTVIVNFRADSPQLGKTLQALKKRADLKAPFAKDVSVVHFPRGGKFKQPMMAWWMQSRQFLLPVKYEDLQCEMKK